MKHAILISIVFIMGCSTTFRPADLDVDEVAPEDEREDTGLEVPVDPREDAEDGPVEPDGPCGAPSDDCDGDGLAPVGGDCCDHDDRVHPGQDGWFSLAYYCPDESWDYNCDFEVEYEQASHGEGLDAVLPEGIQKGCIGFGMGECNDMEGWVGGSRPVCGEAAEYVDCFWYSNPYVSECHAHDPSWSGIMRCR